MMLSFSLSYFLGSEAGQLQGLQVCGLHTNIRCSNNVLFFFFSFPGSYPGPPIAFSYHVYSISPGLREFLWIFLVLRDLDTYKKE